MPLRVNESKIYNIAYREMVLDETTKALLGDERIAGAILVGSGASGFKDRYSDIDLAVLVENEAVLEEVYVDWWGRLHTLFMVVEAFKEPPRHLYGLLLDRHMELDISFQGASELYARRPKWRVLFDRRGVINTLMRPRERSEVNQAAAHEKRMQDSWYYILQGIKSIQRGQPLRATFFIGFLRDEAVLMAGLSRGLKTSAGSYFADTDDLPGRVKRQISDAFPRNLESTELLRALRNVVNLYYSEAERLDKNLGMDRTPRLKATMRDYLSAFS